MIKTGQYLIIKPSFWSRSDCTIINIIKTDNEGYVIYTYEDERDIIRSRKINNFMHMSMVELSSLLKELI